MVCTSVVTMLVTGNNITSWDVLAAGNSSTQLGSDVSSINADLKALETVSNPADFNTYNSGLESKISDADKQFDIISKSPVLKDAQVKKKFQSLKSKWGKYDDFAWSTQKDFKAIGPALVQLYAAQESAAAVNRQGTTSLPVQLDQYQAILDATKKQVSGLKMQNKPDSDLLSALDTYIQASTGNVSQTKADLAARQNAGVIYTDIGATASIAGTYSAAEDAAMNASNAMAVQLDPSSDISALISSLTTLSSRVNQ